MLHQGIQTAGGLVQDQQLRIMLQGAHDTNFFPVAKGEIFHFPVPVQLQAFTQFRRGGTAVFPAQVSRQFQHIPDLHAVVEGGIRGQVTDPLQDGLFILFNVHAENLTFTGSR